MPRHVHTHPAALFMRANVDSKGHRSLVMHPFGLVIIQSAESFRTGRLFDEKRIIPSPIPLVRPRIHLNHLPCSCPDPSMSDRGTMRP